MQPKYYPLLIAVAGAARPPVRAARARADAHHRDRRGDFRDCLHGAQHSGRPHRPRLVRPWRVLRPGGVRGRARAAPLVSRRLRRSAAVCDPSRRDLRLACGPSHFAPPRRLFLAADARALRHAVCDRVSLDGGHRRRERARRRRASRRARGRSRQPLDLLLGGRGARLPDSLSALALPSLGGRPRAGRDPRERAARALHRLPGRSLQALRLHDVGRHHGARRRAVGLQPSLRLGRTDLGAVFRRAARDGGHRRDAFVPRAGARRAVLHPVSRVPVDLDPELAVVFRALVRRLHRVLADRSRRRRRARPGPVSQTADRGRRDGGPRRLRGMRRCPPPWSGPQPAARC